MKRFIALDVGTKRIGVATCDPMGITTRSLEVVQRVPEDKAIERIDALCKEYGVQTVVVGLPVNMDGTVGGQAKDCEEFANKLKNGKLNICFEDERLTSFEAEQILASQGKKYTKDKGLVDMMSAELILRQFLDKRS